MKSMTGFGKALRESEYYQVEVEIKSVNHRFLDMQLRHPRVLNSMEQAIRQTIKETLQRGRVEVYITLKERGDGAKDVVVHWALLEKLVHELQTGAKERFETALSPAHLIERIIDKETFVEIQEAKVDDTTLEALVLETVQAAVAANVQSRQKEGAGIQQVLEENRVLLERKVTELSQFVAVYEQDYRERFEKKLMEWLGSKVEQERLLTEMAILLERGDIHEELDRLMIHSQAMADLLQATQPVGRELDFLIQEMNREVNTIGSKSSPIEIKNAVVQMKTIIEKIREQVQNIE
jgi:TIGR00255 family protein